VAEPGEPVYPVALRVRGKRVLVVGGGAVAERKVAGLLAAGADVTVVAPDVVAALAERGCTVERRAYRRGEVAGYRLVVAATDDRAVSEAVHDDAEAAGVWVNVADEPDQCTFFLPALVRDGPVVVAVSTAGTSPALAGWVRDRVEAALPSGLGTVAEALAAERSAAHARGESTETIDWRARIEALVATLT
jgi:siroheme synthase-like protein